MADADAVLRLPLPLLLPIDSPGFYPGHVQYGVKSMTVKGKQVNSASIKEELLCDCNDAQVHVVMG